MQEELFICSTGMYGRIIFSACVCTAAKRLHISFFPGEPSMYQESTIFLTERKIHCFGGCRTRVVTKILSCRVNTRSRRGIKWLGICFGSIFLLFSNKSSRGPLS